MEVLTLLLMCFTVSGFSYILNPSLTFTQIAGLNTDQQFDLRSERLRGVSVSAEVKENIAAESTEIRKTGEEERSERITPERKPIEEDRPISQMDPEKQTIELKTEHETTKTGNIDEEMLERNQGHVKSREEKSTSGIFPASIVLQEATQRQEHSVPGTVEYVGTHTEELVEMRGNGLNPNSKTETNDESVMVKTALTDDTQNRKIIKTVRSHNTGMQGGARHDETDVKFNESDQTQRQMQEEGESRLVAGISLPETRGDTREDENMAAKQQIVQEKGENGGKEKGEDSKYVNPEELVERGKEDHRVVNNLTPPVSTSSAQVGKDSDFPATVQTITQPQNPPPPLHHNAPLPVPVTPTPDTSRPPTYTKVSLQFPPPSVNVPTLNHNPDLTVKPPHHLKLKEVEVEDVMVKNILLKLEDTREINKVDRPKEGEFMPQVATPKPKEVKFVIRDLRTRERDPTPKSNENIYTAKLVTTQPTGKPKTSKLMENDTKRSAKQKKTSPPRPHVTKPSAKPQLTTARTSSVRPAKRKNKTTKKSKDKKRKKDNKTQKLPEKKKTIPPTHFPYFMDNYCPPECACYGRVVQCSDKGVDKVPHGIPYNARYILLMNNHINSIQLDLLSEYVSMEFLVLSNNRLTDGAIEGAFEGVSALKRLYLDNNLLRSVPNDLPVSLEELRLDNNHLRVMSEAAWARCPSLLVLSLSNNSLGNGSESLPDAVLSLLCNLRTLNLDYNQFTSVPLGLPLSIRELYLKGNLIEQFRRGAFNGISGLVRLDLSANRLTNKGLLRDSFLNTTQLESLNLEGNRLKQVPRHLPQSLKTLNLEGNLISSIKKTAFSFLKNLEHLGLARNKIFRVAPGAFRTLPVLHQLDLCHNTLHQVPRQLPQGLHSVALTHNRIQSVPRDAFCWGNKSRSLSGLVRVELEHNLVDMGKLDAQAFGCLRGFQVVHFY